MDDLEHVAAGDRDVPAVGVLISTISSVSRTIVPETVLMSVTPASW
jgi:hypothetical protein